MREGGLGQIMSSFFELSRSAIIFLVVLATVVVVFGSPVLVRGESMMPNFSTGEVVVIERLTYWWGSIKRGDVVAAKFPADPNRTRLIKRVVGLPGETVRTENGSIFINGVLLEEPYRVMTGVTPYTEIELITLGKGEYFLVGDNRPASSDSRLWGPVLRQDILGRAGFVIFPLSSLQYVDRVNF